MNEFKNINCIFAFKILINEENEVNIIFVLDILDFTE